MSPRAEHTAVIKGSYFIMYGGNSNDSAIAVPSVLTIGSWAATPSVNVSGSVPVARYAHSAVLSPVDGRSWVIFGGAAFADDTDLDDVAVLDLGDGSRPAFAWTAPACTGAAPSARRYHAAAAYGSAMYLVGGVSGTGGSQAVHAEVFRLSLAADATQWAWTRQATANAVPVFGHALVFASDVMVLYGALTTGSVPVPLTDSAGGLLYIDTAGWVWRVPHVTRPTLTSPEGTDVPATAAFLPSVALVANMADDAGPRLVAVGGAEPSDGGSDGAGTSGTAVLSLSSIGVVAETPAIAEKLPAILGGVSVGVFVALSAAALVWWRRRVTAAAAAAAADVDSASPGHSLRDRPAAGAFSGRGGGGALYPLRSSSSSSGAGYALPRVSHSSAASSSAQSPLLAAAGGDGDLSAAASGALLRAASLRSASAASPAASHRLPAGGYSYGAADSFAAAPMSGASGSRGSPLRSAAAPAYARSHLPPPPISEGAHEEEDDDEDAAAAADDEPRLRFS